ncbi:MAG: quinolinate synthase NadA [Pseudobdellovibrionaceae bacterium]
MPYDIKAEILQLKKDKNAILMAHYYEDGDIQDIADEVGDSYYLAKAGQKASADVILLAGVVFMAESVKILNPNKTVLVPDLAAGCSLVDSSPYDKYLKWRNEYPDAVMVTYINSSAEVKALSDIIITSSNAEKIIQTIPKEKTILFGPDQHLGRWLSKKLNRPMLFWSGSCEVHVLFNAKKLQQLILQHPDAVVIAHPECDESVLQFAQMIGSTSDLLKEVETNPAKKFIVATEAGIFHQMQKKRPDVELIQAPVLDDGCNCNNCPYMKLNNLEKIRNALKTLSPEVKLNADLMAKARIPLERMVAGHL